MAVKKVAAFVIGGAIALYILFSLLPSTFELYGNLTESGGYNSTSGQSYFDVAPTGTEGIVGASLIVFVSLVLFVMYNEMS